MNLRLLRQRRRRRQRERIEQLERELGMRDTPAEVWRRGVSGAAARRRPL